MPSIPDDPLTTSKNNSRGPGNLDAGDADVDVVYKPFDLRSVPRYIPPITYEHSKGSGQYNASHGKKSYELSSTNAPVIRRKTLLSVDDGSASVELEPELRATKYHLDRPADGSNPSLPDTTAQPAMYVCLENEGFQETWSSLVALFECIDIRPTSSSSQSSFLDSPAGWNQRPAGNSARSRRSRKSATAYGNGVGQEYTGNNSGERATPPNEDNNARETTEGIGDNDIQSNHGRNSSSQSRFACPFHKSNPVKYAACHNINFKDIDSVVRHHIRKVHEEKKHLPMGMTERLRELGRQRPESRWRAIYLSLFGHTVPDSVSPYWTPARYTRDLAENIEETIQAARRHAHTREEYLRNWDSLMNDYDAEVSQAQMRRDWVQAEGMLRLQQMRDEDFTMANSHNTFHGALPLEYSYQEVVPMPGAEDDILENELPPGIPFMGLLPTPGPEIYSSQEDHRLKTSYLEMLQTPGPEPYTSQGDLPLGTPNPGMFLTPGLSPDYTGVDYANIGYPDPEYGQVSSISGAINQSYFPGVFLDTSLPDAAQCPSTWDFVPTGDSFGYVGHGSQYRVPDSREAGQKTNTYMPSGGQQKYEYRRHHSHDSGYMGSQSSGHLGNHQC